MIMYGRGAPSIAEQIGSSIEEAQKIVNDFFDGFPKVKDWVKATEENANRRAILLVDIENYLAKFMADSIINGIDDAKWADHLETMKALKADEYVALCQEFVDNLDS